MINTEVIEGLVDIYKDDKEMLDIIAEQLASFEEYHSAIYSMETHMKVYTSKSSDISDYQKTTEALDKKRTLAHNSVITAVNVLNRIAEKEGLPLVYGGTVSTERPYRRLVANAVLEYVESVIKNRR